MLESLLQNPAVQAVLAFCAVFSVVFAIYTWIIGKKNKEISYTVKSFVLVEKKKSTIPKMKLLFDNRQVESLTATTITLWNSGNDAIRRGDIVEDKPLILSAPDTVEILDVQVMKQNEKSNHFSVKKMVDGTHTIDFDYMNKKEGAVLQVYHTGPADELALDCKIIGGKPPRQLSLSKAKIKTGLMFSIVMAYIAAGVAAAAVAAAAGAATAVAVAAAGAAAAGAATAVLAADAVVAGAAATTVAGAATAVAVAAAVAGAATGAAARVANNADLFPYFTVSFGWTAWILLYFLRTLNNPFSRIPDSLQ